MEKILFLDFDGVLFDTLREVYLVNRKLSLNSDFLSPIDETTYQKFSKFKYLVYNIWMFYYYNPIIFSEISEENIEECFKTAITKREIEQEIIFCENFLKIREELVKKHNAFWQNLEKPYRFFFEIKKIYEENKTKIVVVSKKNKTAILQRFSTYGLKFNENDVFAREILDKYQSKGEFIKEYMDKFNFDSALFVDDNNNNLKTVFDKRVETLLALWGNAQPNLEGYNEDEAIEKVKTYCK